MKDMVSETPKAPTSCTGCHIAGLHFAADPHCPVHGRIPTPAPTGDERERVAEDLSFMAGEVEAGSPRSSGGRKRLVAILRRAAALLREPSGERVEGWNCDDDDDIEEWRQGEIAWLEIHRDPSIAPDMQWRRVTVIFHETTAAHEGEEGE